MLDPRTPAIKAIIKLAQTFEYPLTHGSDDTKRGEFIAFAAALQDELVSLAHECGADNNYMSLLKLEDVAASCFDVPCTPDDPNPLDPASMRKAHGTHTVSGGRMA